MTAPPPPRQALSRQALSRKALSRKDRTIRLLERTGLGLLLASLAGFAGALGWPFALFPHFRVQFVLAGALLLVLGLVLRRARLGGVGAVLLAVNGATLGPVMPIQPYALVDLADRGPDDPGHITVVSLNLWHANRDIGAVLGQLRALRADVVLLAEVYPQWRQVLPTLGDLYPYRADCSHDRLCQVAVLSRHRFAAAAAGRVDDLLPLAWARIDVPGAGLVTVAATHLRWPLFPWSVDWQRQQTDDLLAFLDQHPGPVVLGGDFNAAPWGRPLSRLAQAGMTRAPGGWEGTWPSWLPPGLRIPIDHILAGHGAVPALVQTGPHVGSDHRPVATHIFLPGVGSGDGPASHLERMDGDVPPHAAGDVGFAGQPGVQVGAAGEVHDGGGTDHHPVVVQHGAAGQQVAGIEQPGQAGEMGLAVGGPAGRRVVVGAVVGDDQELHGVSLPPGGSNPVGPAVWAAHPGRTSAGAPDSGRGPGT